MTKKKKKKREKLMIPSDKLMNSQFSTKSTEYSVYVALFLDELFWSEMFMHDGFCCCFFVHTSC